MNAISVSGLNKSFRRGFWLQKSEVLKSISFDVKKGGVTGFVGKNGAGKTTTIKCLLQLISKDSGDVEILGDFQLTAETRKKLGFLPENPQFHGFLSASEFLRFHGRLAGESPQRKSIEATLSRVGLADVGEKRLRHFSKGMLQRVGLAQAIIHQPQLIVLDEPLSGLDPEGRSLFKRIFKELAHQGVTLFFSSHLLFDVEELCDSLVVLEKGEVVYQGPLKGVIEESSSYSLVTRSGEEVSQQKVHFSDLQNKIDSLRRANEEILSVEKERQSLDSALQGILEMRE